jgi:hypothetical protein
MRNESGLDHLAKPRDMQESDEMDLIVSPVDQKLVMACVRGGVHACGYCLEPFSPDQSSPDRLVEMNPGGWGTRIAIHSRCVSRAKKYRGNLVYDRERGHQARRFTTQATKPFMALKTG